MDELVELVVLSGAPCIQGEHMAHKERRAGNTCQNLFFGILWSEMIGAFLHSHLLPLSLSFN